MFDLPKHHKGMPVSTHGTSQSLNERNWTDFSLLLKTFHLPSTKLFQFKLSLAFITYETICKSVYFPSLMWMIQVVYLILMT